MYLSEREKKTSRTFCTQVSGADVGSVREQPVFPATKDQLRLLQNGNRRVLRERQERNKGEKKERERRQPVNSRILCRRDVVSFGLLPQDRFPSARKENEIKQHVLLNLTAWGLIQSRHQMPPFSYPGHKGKGMN